MLPDDKSQQRVQKLFSELEQIAKEPLTTGGENGTEKDEVIDEIKVEPSVESERTSEEERLVSSVAQQASMQIQNQRSPAATEHSRVEVEEQVRQPQAAPVQVEEQTRQTQSALAEFFSRVADNPIISKELKGRMRGRQGFVLISSYLVLISFFLVLIYLLLTIDGSLSNGDPGFLQTVGKIIFSTVVLLELLMLGFIGPALTSGSIASERERKTIDLLKTSLLSARAIVFGKLGSAVAFLLLLVFTAIPLQSLAFFLGGVGMAEIVVSTLMLVITAIFFCTLGLFFSSFSQRTLIATVLSYATILVSFVLFILLLFSINIISSYSSYPSTPLEDVLNIAMWILFSTNPFFAATMSEVILIDEQSLFLTTNNVLGNSSLTMPSPWIIYLAFYVLLTILLIFLSIYFVNRPDR